LPKPCHCPPSHGHEGKIAFSSSCQQGRAESFDFNGSICASGWRAFRFEIRLLQAQQCLALNVFWERPMKLPRRRFLHLAAGTAVLPGLPDIARAQAYPTRPGRIIYGFSDQADIDILVARQVSG